MRTASGQNPIIVNANKNDLYETVDVWSQMPVDKCFLK